MNIPSQYDPKLVENKIYRKWIEERCFSAEIDSAKKPYTIVIPPPNVTGILHMGHALNNTIQDVLIRYHRMIGDEALWMPGTDHAGIATQNMVEKSLAGENLRKEDIGRDKFQEKLWDWTNKHGSTIIDQLKKLGASCDWNRIRFTMDNDYSQAVLDAFIHLYEKKLIYRGTRIINWCPRCKTALSDEESVRKDTKGFLYYIKYPVVDPVVAAGDEALTENYIVVATTRPETMLGDTAIAVNPKDQRYSHLINVKVILPIVNRQLRVVLDEAVDPAFGTGVVKVTPSHDPVDFALGKKHDLEFIDILNDDAALNENVPEMFRGLTREAARKKVLETLKEMELLEKEEPYNINAGHCYRCHTVIEPRVSKQWFVNMRPLAVPAVKAVEDGVIKFYPDRWEKVYLNWMNNIQDWCISRQIWWGHRLPVYYCTHCQLTADSRELKTENNIGIIVSKVKPQKCPQCGGIDIIQDPDVLDTWFSSWLWPFAAFHWPLNKVTSDKPQVTNNTIQKELNYFYPTNALVTASEILFFWVARMIMSGYEFMGKEPFNTVYIHGTVRDEKGVKMSKSLGNTIDPLAIIEKFGADSLRFSLMMLASSGSDVYLSDQKFLVGRNFCNKIWNSLRFLFMKIEDAKIEILDLELIDLDEIDLWLLTELNQTITVVTAALNEYRVNDAAKRLYEFFWDTLCDWYIEIIKDNFTLQRAKVLIDIFIRTMKLLHPLMPYITEEIFELIKANTNAAVEPVLMKSTWPKPKKLPVCDEGLAQLKTLMETIKTVRTIKNDLGLGTKRVILEIKILGNNKDFWMKNKFWVQRLSFSENIEFVDFLKRVLYKTADEELNIKTDENATGEFLTALDKKIQGLSGVLDKISGRLNNQGFIVNALPEVVQSEKKKFIDISAEIKRLKELRAAFQ